MKGTNQSMFPIALLTSAWHASTCFQHLGVDIWIVGVDKMVGVINLGMHVNAIVDVLYAGICIPHVTRDVALGEDVFSYEIFQSVSLSVWNLHCKAFSLPLLDTSKNPMV